MHRPRVIKATFGAELIIPKQAVSKLGHPSCSALLLVPAYPSALSQHHTKHRVGADCSKLQHGVASLRNDLSHSVTARETAQGASDPCAVRRQTLCQACAHLGLRPISTASHPSAPATWVPGGSGNALLWSGEPKVPPCLPASGPLSLSLQLTGSETFLACVCTQR